MMELSSSTIKKSISTKRYVAIMAVLLASGTGFVALGGDSAVVNYISPSTEKDAEGNIVPHDFSMGKWLHGLHDHLWEHFHGRHDGN